MTRQAAAQVTFKRGRPLARGRQDEARGGGRRAGRGGRRRASAVRAARASRSGRSRGGAAGRRRAVHGELRQVAERCRRPGWRAASRAPQRTLRGGHDAIGDVLAAGRSQAPVAARPTATTPRRSRSRSGCRSWRSAASSPHASLGSIAKPLTSTACGSVTTIDWPSTSSSVDHAAARQLVERGVRAAAVVGVLVAARPVTDVPPESAAQLRRSSAATARRRAGRDRHGRDQAVVAGGVERRGSGYVCAGTPSIA